MSEQLIQGAPVKMNGGRAVFDWTTGRLDLLTELWADGLSCSQIGKKLGISASAVKGKAFRTGLPGRPSPIKRTGPFLKSRAIKRARILERAMAKAVPIKHRKAAAARVAEFASKPIDKKPCQFPSWPHGAKPTHEYCGKNRIEGKPYCPSHCAVAYVKIQLVQKSAA